MVSTDGSRDDEAREEGSPDESVLPPGPRRSTYTPPATPAAAVPGSGAAETSAPAEPPADAPPVAPPFARDDLPAFVPPPPPADFEFLKPETGPVNVVYQLDDVEPNLPFDVAIETLAQSPAGARILPKETPADPAPAAASTPEPAPIVIEPTPIVIEPTPIVVEPTPIVVEPVAPAPYPTDEDESADEPVAEDAPADAAPFDDAPGEAAPGENEPELDHASAEPSYDVSADADVPLTEPGVDSAATVEPEPIPLPDFYEPATAPQFEPRPVDTETEPDVVGGFAEADTSTPDVEAVWPIDPVTEGAPVHEAADAYEPVIDETVIDETMDDAPMPDEPVADEPVADETPAHETAVPDEPLGDQPTTDGSTGPMEPSVGTFIASSAGDEAHFDDYRGDEPHADDARFDADADADADAFIDSPFDEDAQGPVFSDPRFADEQISDEPVPAFPESSTAEGAYDEPAYDGAANGEPAYEESADEQPGSGEPAFHEPAFDQSAYSVPVYERPAFDEQPFAEQPVDESIELSAAFDQFESESWSGSHELKGEFAPDADSSGGVASPVDATADDDGRGHDRPAFVMPDRDTSDAPSAEEQAPAPAPLTEAEQLAALSQQGAPAGRPWIPERRSLKDAELTSLLTGAIDLPNGTLGVMEELERQLQLREEETREFQEWQDSMLAVGTPEAIAAVERVLPQFTDIVPPETAVAIAAAASAVPPPPATPASGVAPPPPPMGAPASETPPPTDQDPASIDVVVGQPESSPRRDHDESPSVEEQERVTSPPPLVEPPAPSPPDSWAFDLDADTVIPEAVIDGAAPEGAVPASGSDDEYLDVDEEVDDQSHEIPPAPMASKYAPTPPADAPIFIDPIPVAPGDGTNTPTLVEPGAFGGGFVDPVYTGPLTGSVSISTGGISVPPEGLDTDIDDPLDEIDQAGFDAVFGANPATAPVLVTRVPEDEVVLGEPELNRPRIFSLEAAGAAPTPEDQRVGRAARMFWMWFAANASIASIAFGGVLFSLGLSLRQAIVAVLAGVAVSFLPLGLGTLAGKRSGQPTMVVSRAAFGLSGNALPAAVAVISRVFWGSALLWVLGHGVASVLDGAGLTGPLTRDVVAYLVMGAGLVIALVFAVFGYGLIVLLQLVSSIASAILIVGLIVLTWQHVDVGVALTHPDGPWLLAGTAAVLVFSFVGLLWANSSGDLARYQRPGSSTPGSMLSTAFGATIPTFLLISYGALLAASDPVIATGLVTDPFDTIGSLLPVWYPAPLIIAIALGLLSAVVVSIYSGGFALTAVGVRLPRLRSAAVVGALIAVGAVALVLAGTDYTTLFRDLATTLAVPVAAWAGIFAADAMIRQRTYDTEALLVRGGIYPTVNWVNLSAFIVIIAVGFGLTTASVVGLGWQGYLFPLLGLPVDGPVAGTDVGVIVALVLGLLTPIVAGIPTIRKQEASPRRTG